MYCRLRLDIDFSDLCFAASQLLGSGQEEAAQRALEDFWEPQKTLVAFSVRSGFDLLLQAQDWPAGSQILMESITIPDMVRIVEHHGYEIIPIDVSPHSSQVDLEAIESLLTPQTRALVITHLYGARRDSIGTWARERGLMLIEDCAQNFEFSGYRGDSDADVSMFSFGVIKTATSLGGGLLVVRDRESLQKMREIQDSYPLQSKKVYFTKIVRTIGLVALGPYPIYAGLVAMIGLTGRDYDTVIRDLVKGFKGDNFFELIRKRPCGALLRLLYRRLNCARTASRHQQRIELTREFVDRLAPEVLCFGHGSHHVFWLVPLLVSNPDDVVQAVRRIGVDASTTSSMIAVDQTPQAAHALEQVFYVPLTQKMSASIRSQMVDVIRATAKEAA